ncbi:MAG TPA: ABC transporter permease [Bryobacteraceae bacterium]|nr:ABC transporter permease [Bryobacteraceae bacterium]
MRFYRALLHLYPASFRAEYGDEIESVFRERLRDASNPPAVIALWISSFFEILLNAIGVHWDILRQDLRYTTRTLLRSPGFAITAILVVALGIGANTAAFSVTDFVLIRNLPFPDSQRLVKMWQTTSGYDQMEFSPLNYRDVKRMSKSYEGMGVVVPSAVNLVGQGDPQRIFNAFVTSEVIPLLGIQPLFGRVFTPSDEREGAPGTVLLSYQLWQSQFAADPGVLGRKVILDGFPYVVIGVMPPQFHFPSAEVALWVPKQFSEQEFQDRNDNYLQVLARLKPGVSLEQAQAEMNVTMLQLKREYPGENKNTGGTVIFLRDEISGKSRVMLWALLGASACVLLIACANLANLLLTRSLSRQRELAVRAALGAGRERLVRQSMTESMLLAVSGGCLGILVAVSAVPLLTRLVPNTLPIASTPEVDFRVLIFAGLLTVLTGVVFGVLPALRASGNKDMDALREGARSGGGRKERLRAALVIAEVTISIVLLISSGLLIRALWKLQGTDPGFRADGVLTVQTSLPMPKYEKTARRVDFYDRVLSGVRALPGVTNAGYVTSVPMLWPGGIWPVSIDGQVVERTASHTVSMRYATPGYFATLGIPLLLGRDVSESDTTDRQFVAVVSQSFARRYWPDQNPLGRHFQLTFHDRMVVGVVGDVRVRGLETASEPQAYLPYRQVPDGMVVYYAPRNLVVRTAGSPTVLAPSIRRIIHEADPEQPASDVQTMDQIVEAKTASRTVQVRVLAAFAAIAFLLAAIGIHGLLSFAVSQRNREIGVRMALGAASGDILRMVMRQGVWVALAGVIPGLALAYIAARLMQAILAGIQPGDLATFASAAGLCVVMTLAGCFLPAWRAVRIDPMTAIRTE